MISDKPAGLVWRRSFPIDAGYVVIEEKWDLEAPGCPMVRNPWGPQFPDRYCFRQIIMPDREYQEAKPTLFGFEPFLSY